MSLSLRIKPKFTMSSGATARKDFRLWIGILLIFSATIAGGKIFSTASHRSPAVVVIHDLAAGSEIMTSDVQLMNVAVPNSVLTIGKVDDVIGKFVAHDLVAGSLLNPAGIQNNLNENLRGISVPIKAGHLPQLDAGASVDVWFTPSMDGAVVPGPAQLLASEVLVGMVPEMLDSTVDNAITLQVSKDVVPQIMQALRDGEIDIAIIGTTHD